MQCKSTKIRSICVAGASLGNLSAGRVSIIGFAAMHMSKALAIAVRYSAVRKQFGPPGQEEIPVLDYPLQVVY